MHHKSGLSIRHTGGPGGMEESGDTAIQSIAERNAIIGRYNVVLVKNYFSCDCQCNTLLLLKIFCLSKRGEYKQ